MPTQETCRCAVADCSLHNAAPEMVDMLKDLLAIVVTSLEPMALFPETIRRTRALIARAETKAEGR